MPSCARLRTAHFANLQDGTLFAKVLEALNAII
jgi:hypothetical protein